MFATPCFSAESYTGLLLFILYFGYHISFVFMVVTASVITTHWSLIFDEISFCHAMPNCDVMLIVKPSWHCSLFEKQRDMHCKSDDISNLLFCNTVKLNLLYIVIWTDRKSVV